MQRKGDAMANEKQGAEHAGPKGDHHQAEGGSPEVKSETPENKEGHINPSAPEDSNTTPGTTGDK
jgi:hypothetical protein